MSDSTPTASPSLDRIRVQHFEFKRRTGQLRDVFEGAALAGRRRAQLDEQLASFDVVLNEHFALEEETGYFSDVLAVAPRLSAHAARLEQAHTGLRNQVAQLRARTRDASVPWEDLRDRFRQLLAELRAHEVAEDELVNEAFMRDLGG